MTYIQNELYLDIDALLQKGVNHITTIEYDYLKSLTHIFLGNLGYGKTWTSDGLDKLRLKHTLHYKEIRFVYQGIEYKVKFSDRTNKHGKILGLNSYTFSFNRPNPEPINDFDIVVDMSWIQRLTDNEVKAFMNEVSSDSMHLSNIVVYRTFLEEDFTLHSKEVLGNVLNLYFVGKQDNTVLDEEVILRDMLKEKGYQYIVELNEEDVNALRYSNRSSGLKMNIKVFNQQNEEDIEGYRHFIHYATTILWDTFIRCYIVESLKDSHNRLVNMNIHYKF